MKAATDTPTYTHAAKTNRFFSIFTKMTDDKGEQIVMREKK